jgi:predicted  nucleic acid-binding Zn-ribbon protein
MDMFNENAKHEEERIAQSEALMKRIEELNTEIKRLAGEIAVEKKRLNDPNLLEKEKIEAMTLQQDASKIEIEIKISESRITELEQQIKMAIEHLRKRFEENRELELKVKFLEKQSEMMSGSKANDPIFKETLEKMELIRGEEMERMLKF